MKKIFMLIIYLIWIVNCDAKPLIIAHRGGSLNFSENTIEAIKKSLDLGCDGVEIDVQLTHDKVPVLFHPRQLNGKDIANYKFLETNLPSLKQALSIFPTNKLLIIDLKSLPAKELIDAVIKITDDYKGQIVFYSTNTEHNDYLLKNYPKYSKFDSRDNTRKLLLEHKINNFCSGTLSSDWFGFELVREINIYEKFALGEGNTTIKANMWTNSTINCFRTINPNIKPVIFSINDAENYEKALKLEPYAIMTDNPVKILEISKTL